MRNNPFRSEADAFRFLLAIILLCALIIVGERINTWLGVAVLFVASPALAWWLFFREPPERPVMQAPPPHPEGERRILVVANETVGGGRLLTEIANRARGTRTRVFVICPALNTHVKHWTNEEDAARAAANVRLEQSLAAIRSTGVDASGAVGDDDPIQAIEDVLGMFAPDELIISTHPEGRSNWLERNVIEHARERFALPVTHVVVDLDAEAASATA